MNIIEEKFFYEFKDGFGCHVVAEVNGEKWYSFVKVSEEVKEIEHSYEEIRNALIKELERKMKK